MTLAKDLEFIRMSLELAKSQMGHTSPDPMVGAVIVKNDKVISKGWHCQLGSLHAEAMALEKAGTKAKGATLYLNLEPCCHYGYNPPCTNSIIKSGIKRVVASIKDPNPLVRGKGFKELIEAGIEVDIGLLQEDAKRLNEPFIKHIITGLPFVILKSAMSIDGKIATHTQDSKYITSKASRQYVHVMRQYVDAILTSVTTVKIDNPLFTVRDIGTTNVVKRNPKIVVIDPLAEIPLSSNILKNEPEKTIVVVSQKAKVSKVEKIRKTGAVVIKMLTRKGNIDLNKLIKELGSDNIMSIMIEAGGNFSAACINAGIVDKAMFFIAPKIIGGRDAVTAIEGKGVKNISDAIDLKMVRFYQFDNDVMIEGYLK